MFNANIFGNDEDIFDDSKSLNDTQSSSDNTNTSSKNFRNSNFENTLQSVIEVLNRLIKNDQNSVEEAESMIKHLKSEHGVELSNFLGQFRIRLASTILDGAGSWIREYQEFEIPRSVVYALDSLSENKFTLVDKYFGLELENAKRIVIMRFLSEVFLAHGNNKSKINSLQELFNTNIDKRYISSYYGALYDINLFTIYQNNGVYEALAKELDLPCNQNILECKEVLLDSLSAKVYMENRFTSFITGDLKNEIGSTVAKYTQRYFDDTKNKNI